MLNSPFPGMDPWLEMRWGDVHHRLIMYSGDAIQQRLPGDLRARVEERVYVQSESGPAWDRYPDVLIRESDRRSIEPAPVEGSVATAEPLVLHIVREPVTEGFINIIDPASGNRVVTTIEFLSPTNKRPGEGRQAYLQKRDDYLEAQVSLVEIDLTRAGKRELLAREELVPPSHQTTYRVCVCRGWDRGAIELYRVPLRQPLPVILIPLRQEDDDVQLDLQALIEQCYTMGRYDDIDYNDDPMPPLDDDDAAWADELLREQERRR